MAKETQKEKIERLEKELFEYKALVSKLQKEISEMQDKADSDFENSPTHKQLLKRLEFLKESNRSLKETLEHKDRVHKLTNEPKHNERGAGRRTKFTDEEIKKIKEDRLQGKTIKELAAQFNCSVGLIHKLINE